MKRGGKMLENPSYNQVKVLNDLSSMAWFVERHAMPDMENCNQPLTKTCYEELLEDLNKHIEKFTMAVEGLCKEGKFE